MATMNEKLNKFTSLVIKDAELKRDALMNEVSEERKKCMAEKEDEFLKEAYEQIQETIAQTQKSNNEKFLHVELESKRKLLLKREEIISEVFSEVREKLKAFTASEQYEGWLLDKIEKGLFEVGKGEKIVYISSNDVKRKGKIEAIQSEDKITVEVAPEKNFGGGARIYNMEKRVSVDYSLQEMIAEEKKKFLQTSGLAIR